MVNVVDFYKKFLDSLFELNTASDNQSGFEDSDVNDLNVSENSPNIDPTLALRDGSLERYPQ